MEQEKSDLRAAILIYLERELFHNWQEGGGKVPSLPAAHPSQPQPQILTHNQIQPTFTYWEACFCFCGHCQKIFCVVFLDALASFAFKLSVSD